MVGVVLLRTAAVKKGTLFLRVAMKVDHPEDLDSFPFQLLDVLLDAKNLGMHGLRWKNPSPIQIVPNDGRPCVSVDDAIGVLHWNHLNT